MSILQILDELAATPSIKAKEAILRREIDNNVLQSVFKAAYDSTITYGIKKIPEYTSSSENRDITFALDNLYLFSTRKVTGFEAIVELTIFLEALSKEDAIVLERIIKRDLRCNTSDTLANKVWKNLIPDFPYMRCTLLKKVKLNTWDWSNGNISQEKADGMFANLDLNHGEVYLSSRSGSQFPIEKFKTLSDDIKKMSSENIRLNGDYW